MSGTTMYHRFDQTAMLGYVHTDVDCGETEDSRSDGKVDTCKPDGKVTHALLVDRRHDSGTATDILTTLKV
jgi:hypothetical protein